MSNLIVLHFILLVLGPGDRDALRASCYDKSPVHTHGQQARTHRSHPTARDRRREDVAALLKAAMRADPKPGIVAEMLRKGVSPRAVNQDGDSAIILAVISDGHSPSTWTSSNQVTVNLLLTAGASPNSTTQSGDSVLDNLAGVGDLTNIRLALDHGARIEHGRWSALFDGLESDDVVALLLAHGARVNCRNAGGGTPLHDAALVSQIVTIRRLLRAEAKVNASDNFGLTPLMYAAMRLPPSGTEVMKLLLSRGASTRAETSEHQTALHFLYSTDHPGISSAPMVALLIAHGVDVNVRDDVGDTALMNAAAQGDIASVKLLISAGADPKLRDRHGRSLVDLARTPAVATQLREAIARAPASTRHGATKSR